MFLPRVTLAASCHGGVMATQLEEVALAGASPHRAATLTPQARRLVEGPVLTTLLRLAAPTVALMLLQAVIAAGEAAFVGRLGSDALAGVSLSFPLVMLMTTLSAGAYGGGVASGVARALGAGKVADAARVAGTALGRKRRGSIHRPDFRKHVRAINAWRVSLADSGPFANSSSSRRASGVSMRSST